tara:strand:+ start:47583 stop:47804 length:222 start_codon:yes stop_codon:yes gene_type:complete
MLALRLPEELEKRLQSLADKTNRSKSFYARKAIEEFLEDREDYFLALAALEKDDGKRYSLKEVEKILGINKND